MHGLQAKQFLHISPFGLFSTLHNNGSPRGTVHQQDNVRRGERKRLRPDQRFVIKKIMVAEAKAAALFPGTTVAAKSVLTGG
jgi:hypothetical protein